MGIKRKVHDLFFKNKILRKAYCSASYIKGKIRCRYQLVQPIKSFKEAHTRPIFLVFTPEHANLGDHAIAYAEQKMLEQCNIKYYEITGAQLYVLQHYGYLSILNDAVVLVNGGGNLGTLWPEIEEMNRQLIAATHKSTVFIMPNSIFYDNTSEGQKAFQDSIDMYNQHPKLYLYARERFSYKIMCETYRHVELIPDMVFSLNESIPSSSSARSGCLLCLRRDIETTLLDEERKIVQQTVRLIFDMVIERDNVLDHNVAPVDRRKELEQRWDEFRSVKLVITDRLHGMIFAAITGTPCIVLNSKSPKLRGCYDWIKDLDYIKFADSPDDIPKLYKEIPGGIHHYDNQELLPYFYRLQKNICTAVRRG